MSKTPVVLFEHPGVVDHVVSDLDASSFPRDKIGIIGEPRKIDGDGVTSTPRIDFEVGFNRELTAIGASGREADAYVQVVRRGGVLVLATGSNEQVDNAATIMNRHDAMELAELTGSRPGTLSARRKHDTHAQWLIPDRAAAPACLFGRSRANASTKPAGVILMRRLHSQRQLLHLGLSAPDPG